VSNRVLAVIICLPIAGAIGFAAGRATSNLGTVTRVDAPNGAAHLRVDRRFSLGPVDQRLILSAGGEEIELRKFDEQTGTPGEIVWAPDGSRAARGVGFSANAVAITFDDCPRSGAGCRPRFMVLPRR